MRFNAYLQFRFGCLHYELQLLWQQLQQLLLGAMLILGPAIAALLMMLLLAYGLFYRADLPASQAILLGWALLCAQSLLLWLYRDALLGRRYQLFLASLAMPGAARLLVDQLLLLLCHPLLWLHLLIIGSANFSQWQQVWPQLCFAVLQYAFAVALLYRGVALLWLFMLSLPLLWLPTLPLALLGWSLVPALLYCWPLLKPLRRNSGTAQPRLNQAEDASAAQSGRAQWLPPAWQFWWQQTAQQPAALLSRLLLMALVLALGHISQTERPDLAPWIGLLSAAFLVLNSAGWQVSQSHFCQQYALFLAQFPPQLRQLQYAGPLLLMLLSIAASSFCFGQALPLQVLLPGAVLSFAAACWRPHWLVPVWVLAMLLSGGWLHYHQLSL